jgi:ubiquinone biosynthesis protein
MISIRKIGVISRTYRNLNRYRQILTILFKYGFGDMVELLKIEQYIEIGLQMISKKRRERIERLSKAERMRMSLEELGPTYIKLGQILSIRPDLVPVDFIEELSKLQDKVPAYPFSDFKHIISEEFGKPAAEVFEYLEETPLASASIGQVHRARLKGGEEVAVKVQRPGIAKIIEVDLEIMLHLATLMERHIEELSLHKPVRIVEEFAKSIEKEMNYTLEANNMERMASHYLSNKYIYIPKVFKEYTTRRVLTTEFIYGIKVSDLTKLESSGLNRKIICNRGADILLSQIFIHGFFHADPHPGNIFVLPKNIICLIDFGMMGSIDRRSRESFVELVSSIVTKRASHAVQILLQLTDWEIEPNLRELERDVAEFMDLYLYKPLKEIEIGPLLNRIIELAARHRLRILPELFIMLKSLSVVEGVARMLNPDFDTISKAEPFIRQIKSSRFHPQRLSEDMWSLITQLFEFAHDFPKDLLEITRTLRQKKLTINLELKGLETMLSTHDQISNRISFSIIIAALIIGSALIVRTNTPPLFYGISMIGIVGFLAAAIMGVWLLVAILKKGKL